MTKQTLNHQINGKVFTRQTARNYTHVIVAAFNRDRALRGVKKKPMAEIIEEATYEYKYNKGLRETPVGQKYYYHRHQGGSYLNRSGKHMEVKQWMIDLSNKHHADTLEGEIARLVEYYAEIEANTKRQIEKTSEQPFVYSWHGRADLAEKQLTTVFNRGYDVHVEAVNGGA